MAVKVRHVCVKTIVKNELILGTSLSAKMGSGWKQYNIE